MVVPGRGKRVFVVLVGFCVVSLFVVNVTYFGIFQKFEETLTCSLSTMKD